ncbi:hypothetical protein [Pseudomonas parafulva]|uniref:hypothetical protein n=1 Tax=Pseudomonas parafulva TaxID=157782 RepID=UPI000412D703|nr:hypothetical protein [Pseudomonas parafulva]
MKKIVPDPPLPCTSTHAFGRCDAGYDHLFTVNPNISAEDALVHVALYLRGAYEIGYKALDYLREEGRPRGARSALHHTNQAWPRKFLQASSKAITCLPEDIQFMLCILKASRPWGVEVCT